MEVLHHCDEMAGASSGSGQGNFLSSWLDEQVTVRVRRVTASPSAKSAQASKTARPEDELHSLNRKGTIGVGTIRQCSGARFQFVSGADPSRLEPAGTIQVQQAQGSAESAHQRPSAALPTAVRKQRPTSVSPQASSPLPGSSRPLGDSSAPKSRPARVHIDPSPPLVAVLTHPPVSTPARTQQDGSPPQAVKTGERPLAIQPSLSDARVWGRAADAAEFDLAGD
jgi:hypothetical protein